MLWMIRELEDCKLRSFCVSSPLSWVLVDDVGGVYLLWTGHMTVFPLSCFPPAQKQSITY